MPTYTGGTAGSSRDATRKLVSGRREEAQEVQVVQVYSIVPSCANASKKCLIIIW